MERAPEIGGQYPERRAFERKLGENPFAQAQAARFLISYHMEAVETGHHEAAHSAAILLQDLCNRYPEFLQNQPNLDHDLGYEQYIIDDRLINLVRNILESTI